MENIIQDETEKLNEIIRENQILSKLREIFNEYKSDDGETVLKLEIIKLFFTYNIIDTCGFDIFQLSQILETLNPTNDRITLKQFLLIIFHIYRTQLTKENPDDNDQKECSSISDMTLKCAEDLSKDKEKVFNNTKYNIISIMKMKKENTDTYFYFHIPNFENNSIQKIVSNESLEVISSYHQSLTEELFKKYSEYCSEKKLRYISIFNLNKFFYDYPINTNYSTEELGQHMTNFINVTIKNEEEQKIFNKLFEKRNLSEKEIHEIFNEFREVDNDVNFSYSTFAIMLAYFSCNLQSSALYSLEGNIQFFFETQLKLVKDSKNKQIIDLNIEENNYQVEEEVLKESEDLFKAKNRNGKYSKEDEYIIEDLLKMLDKLPLEEENILYFSNDIPNHNNTLSYNQMKVTSAKFPVELLDVEIQEKKAKELEAKEEKQILKAAKPKKNKDKNKNANPLEFNMEDEIPNEDNYNLKYFGKEKIETLTYRLLKNTYKEILPNSNVYPSLIKEVLMIPSTINSRIAEMILGSFKEQVTGHIENAIKKLEKAKEVLNNEVPFADIQTQLFFSLSLGSLYETMNFDVFALKHYSNSLAYSDKLPPVDPDKALVYCFLGEIFTKIREYHWAMKCYLYAKKIREETIGGNTPDTAAVYNNLGVIAYYLQSFLPANGYFKLAYEIYKEELGLTHPRTLLIKSNISKMNYLCFNKKISFKTLSMYPIPPITTQSSKKKK